MTEPTIVDMSPGEEAWTIVIDGTDVYVLTARYDDDGDFYHGLRQCSLGELKSRIRDEPPDCVVVAMPSDAQQRGAVDFAAWVESVKVRVVVPSVDPHPTLWFIEEWKQMAGGYTQSLGNA
jgi:hypothetical protein